MQRPLEYGDAILSLRPGAQWVIEDRDLSKLTWISEDIERPSDLEIEEELKRLQLLRELEQEAAIAAKESALSKLKKLGLSQEEIIALAGVTIGA